MPPSNLLLDVPTATGHTLLIEMSLRVSSQLCICPCTWPLTLFLIQRSGGSEKSPRDSPTMGLTFLVVPLCIVNDATPHPTPGSWCCSVVAHTICSYHSSSTAGKTLPCMGWGWLLAPKADILKTWPMPCFRYLLLLSQCATFN